MVFNSYIFIMVFLPAVLAGWYILNALRRPRLAELFLMGMSAWFYGSFSVWNLAVLVCSAVVNYLISWLLDQCPEEKKRRILMWAAVAFHILMLSVFKYGAGIRVYAGISLLMPVGLSFWTFSQISYIVDRARGELKREPFWDYLLYISFFPKLAEGPITNYTEVMTQFRDPVKRIPDRENLCRGFILFVLGMSKKVLIADSLAPVAQFGFQSAYYLDLQTVLVTMTAYTFQLYFDFSGFIDMARGVSQMLGITLPVNFDAPFRQTSFGQFWKHWHSTLSRFLTKYVYIPLGGSRKGKIRTWINVMAVFLISGLWHGNGWTYLIWGALTGALVLLFNNVFRKWAQHPQTKAGTALWRFLTFTSFACTLAFFGAPGVQYGLMMFRRFSVLTWPGFLYRAARNFNPAELYLLNKAVSMLLPELSDQVRVLSLLLLLAACIYLVNRKKTADTWAQTTNLEGRQGMKSGLLTGLLLVWCLTSLTGVSDFLYFKF